MLTAVFVLVAGDERVLRRMVLDRKLAPFFPGEDDPGDDKEECPICMLYYAGGLNRSSCCQQGICSECFLQICPRANKQVKYEPTTRLLVPAPVLSLAPSAFAPPLRDACACSQLPVLQGE